MDEVDNIIIHSLRQIGCQIDDDISTLSKFTPELLVSTVASCLRLIDPTLSVLNCTADSNNKSLLPTNMAQRFAITTDLAEACKSIGFRGDIGYQTFLYTNVTEVRRVFMYLIERLPKESSDKSEENLLDRTTALKREIARNIGMQLKAPWTPQYCKKYGIRQFGDFLGMQMSCCPFEPQNLNVPYVTDPNASPELQEYWLKRSPTIFQQTSTHNICATIIHQNDRDCLRQQMSGQKDAAGNSILRSTDEILKLLRERRQTEEADKKPLSVKPTVQAKPIPKSRSGTASGAHLNDITVLESSTGNPNASPSKLDALNSDIDKLKQSIDACVATRTRFSIRINEGKAIKIEREEELMQLSETRRIKERTHILLESPEVNIKKMETLLDATRERMKLLTDQWEEHRKPLCDALEKSKQKHSGKFSKSKHIMDQIKSTRDKADELADDLKTKTSLHSQLITELETVNKKISRNAYTSRILEIVGNIRKQKNDIDKVLKDTRDLQKEINIITGQLDRQFTVTDDLLFKTAKRDDTTKKAYKMLAALHEDSGDLIKYVQDTGAIMREVRDLEDQIETEKTRNVSLNLERITTDLKQLEREAKDLQTQICNIAGEAKKQ